MNRFLVLAAALIVLGGCGKEEEPPAMEQAETPSPSAEAMGERAEGLAEQAEQAQTMADEAAAAAEGAAEEAETAADEAAVAAEQAAEQAAEEATTVADRGKQVYDTTCFACHAEGIAGAPKLGDKSLWEPRIVKGMDALVSNAINGFQGSTGVMPPKGGRMDLSDEDVRAAVSYMVEQVQ